MSRSRKISTDISIETKLNKVSEFAALVYSWAIPHAKDDCRLPKNDPEELRLLMFPGRNKTAADMAAALGELVAARLLGVDADALYFFPSEVFYKYQSYINQKNRRETPNLNKITGAENSRDQQKTAENSREVQKGAENSSSPSPSPSHSLKSPAKNAGAVDNLEKSDDGQSAQKVKNLHQQTEVDALVNLAVEIGAGNAEIQQKLCQWVISMHHTMRFKREPPERVVAVVRASLEVVRKKLASGYEIQSVWGLLEPIFNQERTKYMQGPENEGHKKGPISQAARDLMRGIG